MDASAKASPAARFSRLAAAVAQIERRSSTGDPSVVAAVRVRTARGERDVFFGPRARLDAEPLVLDARSAPLARLLYDLTPGEDYEVDVGERTVAGELVERARLVVRDGALAVLVDDDAGLSIHADGSVDSIAPHRFVLAEPPSMRSGRSGVDIVLDPIQREAASRPAGESMLITGEAGAGKTTVALARLVALARADPEFRGAYVAPTEGLARFVTLGIERSGARGIEVTSFDALATRLVRRRFRRLPTRVASDAPASVIRLKRDAALADVLPQFVASRPQMSADEDRPGQAAREDLLHLFGDRERLESVRAASQLLASSAVEATIERTRHQFRQRAEDEFADVVDATKLDALDGRSLDAGTPDDLAGRIDVEDFPVLFEIDRLRNGAVVLPDAFDAIVVDEAQELAVLELRLLRRLLRPGGTLVVAGDDEQRTEAGVGFRSFDATLEELGIPAVRHVHLATSYRCPPELADIARALRSSPSIVVRETSRTIAAAEHDDEIALTIAIAAEVRRIRDHDTHATIAVVARSTETARRVGRPLVEALDAELVAGGRFDFRRAFHVTTVADVRGLEFDYVLLPDVDAATYPQDDDARRALYLALTRTCAAASMAWVGRRSPIVIVER